MHCQQNLMDKYVVFDDAVNYLSYCVVIFRSQPKRTPIAKGNQEEKARTDH